MRDLINHKNFIKVFINIMKKYSLKKSLNQK